LSFSVICVTASALLPDHRLSQSSSEAEKKLLGFSYITAGLNYFGSRRMVLYKSQEGV
jgi:hypothetical protein